MADETYYSLLEIAETASAAEIKAGYLRMIREVHPDRLANAPSYWQRQAEEKAKEINEAHAVLRDREQRRVYDAQLASYRGSGRSANGNYNAQAAAPPPAQAAPPAQSVATPPPTPAKPQSGRYDLSMITIIVITIAMCATSVVTEGASIIAGAVAIWAVFKWRRPFTAAVWAFFKWLQSVAGPRNLICPACRVSHAPSLNLSFCTTCGTALRPRPTPSVPGWGLAVGLFLVGFLVVALSVGTHGDAAREGAVPHTETASHHVATGPEAAAETTSPVKTPENSAVPTATANGNWLEQQHAPTKKAKADEEAEAVPAEKQTTGTQPWQNTPCGGTATPEQCAANRAAANLPELTGCDTGVSSYKLPDGRTVVCSPRQSGHFFTPKTTLTGKAHPCGGTATPEQCAAVQAGKVPTGYHLQQASEGAWADFFADHIPAQNSYARVLFIINTHRAYAQSAVDDDKVTLELTWEEGLDIVGQPARAYFAAVQRKGGVNQTLPPRTLSCRVINCASVTAGAAQF